MKECSRCKEVKTFDLYQKDRKCRDGLRPECKACTRIRQQERQQNKELAERIKTQKREWSKRNEESERARKRELDQKRRLSMRELDEMPKAYWDHLIRFYGPQCLACGATELLTHDHVVPLSKGGVHNLWNAQVLCRSCNCAKSDKSATDYRPNGVLVDVAEWSTDLTLETRNGIVVPSKE